MDRLTRDGYSASFEILDVTDSAAVTAMAEGMPAVDILVANAGVARSGEAAHEVSDETFLDVMNVNLNGVYWCCRAFGAKMREAGKGSIVTIGSISAMIANVPQRQSYYNASKAAVHQLTRSLAAEWAADGVRVNAIAPGYIVDANDRGRARATRRRRRMAGPHADGPLRSARGGGIDRAFPRQRRVELHDRLGGGGGRRIHALVRETIAMETIPKTMRAVICHGPEDYRLEEAPTPQIGPGEVLVRTVSAGICASDAKCWAAAPMFWGDARRPRLLRDAGDAGPRIRGRGGGPRRGRGRPLRARPATTAVSSRSSPCWRWSLLPRGSYWMCMPHEIYGFHGEGIEGAWAEYLLFPAERQRPGRRGACQ